MAAETRVPSEGQQGDHREVMDPERPFRGLSGKEELEPPRQRAGGQASRQRGQAWLS